MYRERREAIVLPTPDEFTRLDSARGWLRSLTIWRGK